MKDGAMMKRENNDVLYDNTSLDSYWVGYTVEWAVAALVMTLLSLVGYFHYFSILYAVIACRWSFLLWLTVPGFIRIILNIPIIAQCRSAWLDIAITAFVVIGLWLLGGYIRTYYFKSDFFYVEQDRSVYHVTELCDCAHGPLREMQGYEVAKIHGHLCQNCEDIADQRTVGIPRRYR